MNRRNFLKTNTTAGLTIGLLPLVAWQTKGHPDAKILNGVAHGKNSVTDLSFIKAPDIGAAKQVKYIVVYDDANNILHVANWVHGNAVASPHNFVVGTKERLEKIFPGIDIGERMKFA